MKYLGLSAFKDWIKYVLEPMQKMKYVILRRPKIFKC